MQSSQLTEQDLITQICKERFEKHLFETEHENELYLWYIEKKGIKEIRDKLYESEYFAYAMNNCTPIETIYAIASDIERGQLVIVGHEYLKHEGKEPNPKEKVRVKQYHELTERQKVVADVHIDYYGKKKMIDCDSDNTLLTIRCWRRENADFDRLFAEHWHLESEIIALPAKAISITRLRRFAEKAIREQFSLVK